MKSIFGNNVIVSIFGESHNSTMGVTINGLKSGIYIDVNFIKEELLRRRPNSKLSTSRIEVDEFEIVSGLFNNYTTASPLTVLVKNENITSSDYQEGNIRPSTSDYPAYIRSNGYNDYRGSGHFSGRITVLLVIAGAICKQVLNKENIKISSSIYSIKGISYENKEEIDKVFKYCLENNDSVGGVIKCCVSNLKIGLGEPFFDSVESVLSHLLFSIPAVKKVAFGEDVDNSFGSLVLDELSYNENKVMFSSNNSGGINGGLTNGNTIVCFTHFKPTPTIPQVVKTINIINKTNITKKFVGRHDYCIALRSGVIVESVIAIGLIDLISRYYGMEWM